MLIFCPRASYRLVRSSKIITVRIMLEELSKNRSPDYVAITSWAGHESKDRYTLQLLCAYTLGQNVPWAYQNSNSTVTVLSLPKITALRACSSKSVIMSSSQSDESQSVSRSRSGSEEDRVRRFRSGMSVQSRSESGRSSSGGESNSPSLEDLPDSDLDCTDIPDLNRRTRSSSLPLRDLDTDWDSSEWEEDMIADLLGQARSAVIFGRERTMTVELLFW
jgi:hypothetical protein